MKELMILGERKVATKIVKGTDYIIGYNNQGTAFEYKGITNFNDIYLLNGAEWDLPQDPVSKEVYEIKKDIEILFEIVDNLQRAIEQLQK